MDVFFQCITICALLHGTYSQRDSERRCDLPPSIDVTDGLDHVISYPPFSEQYIDCLFLITASDAHWISLHFLFIEQFTILKTVLKITVGDGHDPSDQSTLLHAVTYNEFLPVTFREYVTARSSRMWITQKVETLPGLEDLPVLLFVGILFTNQALNATVTEIPPYECGKGQYRCPTGICIQNSSICDGYVDCEDYGDELGCNACMDNEIFCRSQNRCIHVDTTCSEYEECQGDNIFVCAPCGRRTIELSHHVQPFTLTSPNYPQNYDSLECIWQIVAPPGNHVFVTVQVLQLTPFDSLSFGWGDTFTNKTTQIGPKLTGHDNPLVAMASRNELMWIALTYVFLSSEFSFHVESRKNVSCEEEQVTCGSPDLICLTIPLSRFLELHHCGLATCGRTTIELSHHVQPFTLTSTNYPQNYYDRLECIWQIVAPPGNHVFVTVQVLQLKDQLSFGWGDTFTNKTTQIGPKLIGSDIPLVALASRNDLMWIVFMTNAREAISGFSCHVESRKNVSCEEEQVTCGSPDLICLTRPLSRFLELYHCGLVDSCGERTIYLTEDTIHNLTSPHYPGNYENNMDCTWKILADDPNGFIEFNFFYFDTESKYDKVTITSPGLSLGDISTTKTDAIYTITGDELVMSGPTKLTSILTGGDVSYVMFTSDGSVTRRGFRMEIKIRDSIDYDICDERGFHCDDTSVCVSIDAVCDGFVQCGYGTDENQCSSVSCQEFFKCSRSGQCLLWEQVCDGTEQCLLGDDEINCGNIPTARDPGNPDSMWASSHCIIPNPESISDSKQRRGQHHHHVSVVQTRAQKTANEKPLPALKVPSALPEVTADELREAQQHDPTLHHIRELTNSGEVKMGRDRNRCPDECDCWYEEGDLYVVCQSGWEKETLNNIAATTDVLRLSGGNMSKLEPGNFKRFFRLNTLYLTNNGIEEMQPLLYEGLGTLSWLNISQNNFTVLEKDTFKELINLQGIVIQDVPVARIKEAAFRGLDELKTIVLMRGRFAVDDAITVNPNAIQNLAKLRTLYVDDYRLCCEFIGLKTFDTERCYTTQQQSPLFNCGSLMQNTFLRVFMWILGLSALVGNIAVVTWRWRIALTQSLGEGTKYVHNFLVLNLAISDFLMGVYMITIATADIYFGQLYYTEATSWRLGRECKFAGIVSVLSSEASVLFVTLISLDRFFCIVYPHGMIRLTRFTARIAVATIWVAGFMLSGLPTILVDADSDIYGLSDVCIGLPLITKPARYDLQVGSIGNVLGSQSFSIPVPTDHKPAWTYSIILFLGVNLVCFLIITFAYTVIFLKFRASHQRMKESRVNMSGKEEMTMALRMAVIVGTDLLCWMPVILMGILSQTGAVIIQPDMYAWTVVFILPINSSLNPYLYTIFSIISDRRSKGKATSINVSCFSRCCRKTNTEKDSSICTCDLQCQTSETHL